MGMAAKPQFEVIEDGQDLSNSPAANESDPTRALDVLLAIFSQKTATALNGFYSLLTVASVFWLSFVIIPNNPSVQQLVGLGGYASFVLAVNIIVRRK
jgi:hypothetical protein